MSGIEETEQMLIDIKRAQKIIEKCLKVSKDSNETNKYKSFLKTINSKLIVLRVRLYMNIDQHKRNNNIDK